MSNFSFITFYMKPKNQILLIKFWFKILTKIFIFILCKQNNFLVGPFSIISEPALDLLFRETSLESYMPFILFLQIGMLDMAQEPVFKNFCLTRIKNTYFLVEFYNRILWRFLNAALIRTLNWFGLLLIINIILDSLNFLNILIIFG